MKKLLAALLLAVALPVQAQEIPDWFSESFLDVREDVADAAKQSKRLMLYFWLEGCPYCREMEEVTFRDPAVVARAKRDFVAVALNVRGDREVTWTDGKRMSEKQFTAFMKVRGTPTVLFLDENGAVVERASGYVAPAKFRALLEAARARAPVPR